VIRTLQHDRAQTPYDEHESTEPSFFSPRIPQPTTTPCFEDWNGRFGRAAVSSGSSRSILRGLCPRFRRATAPRVEGYRRQCGGGDLRQHHRCAGSEAARRSLASTMSSTCWPAAPYERRDPSSSKRELAPARGQALEQDLDETRRLFPPESISSTGRRDALRPGRRSSGRVGFDRYHVMHQSAAGAALRWPRRKARLADINEAAGERLPRKFQPETCWRTSRELFARARGRGTILPAYPISFAPAGRVGTARGSGGLARQAHRHGTSRLERRGPFLQFSARRDLREKMFRRLDRSRRRRRRDPTNKGDHPPRLVEAAVRARPSPSGYDTFADYRLDERPWPKTPEAVARALLEPGSGRRPRPPCSLRDPRRHAGIGAGGEGKKLRARAVGTGRLLRRRKAAQSCVCDVDETTIQARISSSTA